VIKKVRLMRSKFGTLKDWIEGCIEDRIEGCLVSFSFNSYLLAVCEVGFHWVMIEMIINKFLQATRLITIAALPL
jgi:hypothetical protein